MSTEDDKILSEAVAWHFASESDGMDWDAFTIWLEADPLHRATFDEIALADRMLDEHRAEISRLDTANGVADIGEPDTHLASPPARKLRWAGMAIAASLAAAFVVPQLLDSAPEIYATEGASRRIALEDGSSVLLAPHSRLTVEGRGQDRMALSGGALFDIRHDPSRALTVSAGDLSISDIGTRFDVQSQDRDVRVAVIEGKVAVSSDSLSKPIKLAAGNGLVFDASAGVATVAAVDAADVGAWKDGRLTYANARLALVAGDLRRYAGVEVEVPEALRDRRFSGTLIVDDGEAALRDLAQLMGLRLGGHPGAWRLERP